MTAAVLPYPDDFQMTDSQMFAVLPAVDAAQAVMDDEYVAWERTAREEWASRPSAQRLEDEARGYFVTVDGGTLPFYA